jgi:hypothetical protein
MRASASSKAVALSLRNAGAAVGGVSESEFPVLSD